VKDSGLVSTTEGTRAARGGRNTTTVGLEVADGEDRPGAVATRPEGAGPWTTRAGSRVAEHRASSRRG
jgi:hypothetical protein